jgi:hypothetical protein
MNSNWGSKQKKEKKKEIKKKDEGSLTGPQKQISAQYARLHGPASELFTARAPHCPSPTRWARMSSPISGRFALHHNRTLMLPPVSWISAAMTPPRTGFKKRTRDPSLSSLCLLLFPPPLRKNYAAARGGKIPPPPWWNSLSCHATGEEPSSSSSQYLHAVVGVRQRSGNLSVPSG